MLDKSRNVLIKGATLNFAKLHTPVSPFGTAQWELQIETTDKATADDWKSKFLNVKSKDGKYTVSLNRKKLKSDGSENEKPVVVDTLKQPIDTSKVLIGNGSLGNVIVYQYNYDVAGRKGVGTLLSKVQVTELKQPQDSVDFDIIDDVTQVDNSIDDDDMPF
jgi:hypothetical protein